ncbi:TPA: PA3496 family putative envelope integrity protein [Legionella pneumophila]|uniref:Uncharacterized protein n=5 Tax=Legionella pneumophila TaxID=446 RepID=Q5ZXY6_LEGPH|nr:MULTISPECIES: hypothetical protein [Legionella]ERH44359.1 hypothetical protein N751_13590 [Legionella pneumophila str. Leg01/11]ERH45970.1 hypothetical protein N750_05685 [Legionella pneumophila str. Leg01/53]ERI48091.1 hypothetical protein N749_11110 [Legionella pneumophila str. Leg01/20]AAU26683.1 hypothetical protein lpg0594 [Legionella pneumophila subsp. pneumophila str. Philadelphia 1]ABQ56619.1 hypothetical protein conserved within Legionellae [Legionella pneumophila str. Corby]
MSDLFEEDEEEVIEVVDDFDDVEVDTEIIEAPGVSLDARRRLENMLEEKRLRDELDDFVDY